MQNTTNIFIFYAQKDQAHFEELEKHLALFSRRMPTLNMNHKGKILLGTETQQEIDTLLSEAHIVILLLSVDLENCPTYDLHRNTIVNLHKNGKIAVLPVRLRHYPWRASDWSNLTTSPQACVIDGKPHEWITDYKDIDLAFTKVAEEVEPIFSELQKKQLESTSAPGERKNNEFWILVLSSCKDQLTPVAGLQKKQCDKLSNWKEDHYGDHIFDWKPFKNENTIGELLKEYAQKSKFDVKTLHPHIYDDFHTIATHKQNLIVIVDCFALSHCKNKKNKGQIASVFNIINEIGGLLIPICNRADADVQKYLMDERDKTFEPLFKPYYTSELQRAYVYIEINVPTKAELFRKLSNIAAAHLQLKPLILDLAYNNDKLEHYKTQLPTHL